MLTTTITINNWQNMATTSISLTFEVLEPELMQRPTKDTVERLRQAYEHYVKTTEQGQRLIRENLGQPSWAHLLSVPNEYLKPYGFRRLKYTLSNIVLDANDIVIDTTPGMEVKDENKP